MLEVSTLHLALKSPAAWRIGVELCSGTSNLILYTARDVSLPWQLQVERITTHGWSLLVFPVSFQGPCDRLQMRQIKRYYLK